MTGVYEARKKSGEIYYRASFTYKNKHISLGSSSDEASCHAMYNEACEIINNSSDHWIDTDHRTTSYNEAMTLSLGKYISLINFRDNNIYIKTPIYMCHKYFLYFLKEHEVLQFSTDDLFYYSNHTIMSRGGYYFVNDYGMQTSILSRFGVRSHSVKGRDYVFKMGIRMITDTKTFLLSINTMVFPSLLRMDELCTEPGFILTATIYSVNSHPKRKLQLHITRPLTCFQTL